MLAATGGPLGWCSAAWALTAGAACWASTRCRAAPKSASTDGSSFTRSLVAVVGLHRLGVLPLVRSVRLRLVADIRDEGRTGTATSQRSRRPPGAGRRQVAFALVLLVGARLLLASFQRILAINPGFKAEGVSDRRSIGCRWRGMPTRRRMRAVRWTASCGRVGLPGVAAAGSDRPLPFGGDDRRQRHPRRGLPDGPGRVGDLAVNHVDVIDGYFETVGQRLIARPRRSTSASRRKARRARRR